MHFNLKPQWSKLIAVCLIFQAINCLEFRSFSTQTNYANCKTFSTSAISIIYCDQKYYWLSNLDPLNTIYDSGDLDQINSTSASTSANQIQYSYSRFLTKTLQVDSIGNPTFAQDPLFQANDIVNRTIASASVIIEDFLFINNQYGVIKLNNNSFIPFMVVTSTTNKYFARKDVATLRTWTFDQNNQYLTFGNGTEIIRSTLNVTKNAQGTITNITFIDQVLYRRLNHTSFSFQGTYLVVSCSTCDNNVENQTYIVNTTNPTTNVTTSRQQWQTNSRFTQQCLLNQYYDNYKCNQCGSNQGVYDFQMRQCESCYDMVKQNDTFASAMAFQFCTNPFDQGDNNKPNDTDPVPVDPEPVKNDTNPDPPPVVKDKESSSDTNIGLIVGIVVGVIVIIIIIVVVVLCCRKYKKQKEEDEEKGVASKASSKAKPKQQAQKPSNSRKDAYIDKNPTTDQDLNKNLKGAVEDDSDSSRPNLNKVTHPEFQASSPDNIEIKLDDDRVKTGIKGSDEENRPLSSKNQKPLADGPPASQRPFAQLGINSKAQPQNGKESARNRLQIRGDAQYSGVEPQANDTSFSSDYDDRTQQSPESFAGMGAQKNGARFSYSSNSNISRLEGGQRKISNNVQVKKQKEDSVQDEQSDEDIRVAKPSERNLVNDKFGNITKSSGQTGAQLNGIGIRNGSQVTGANIVQNQPAGNRSNIPNNNNIGRQDIKSNGDKKNQVQRQDSSVRGSENSISDDDE
ncbi:UNKNOWN [Stylonychia lemnae]|uniref:Transmembrane protein n=1 Tax=Stylonychia lemnae TaxID=5949 RepID=A0A077ZTZ6_STYLE|nr:UNKNOWN [Stylonychia lemnae]|eukprot:CDW73337.1 UNKNOWN [Stylonychia lemnae]